MNCKKIGEAEIASQISRLDSGRKVGPYRCDDTGLIRGPGIDGWPKGKIQADALNIAYAEGLKAGKAEK